MSIDEKDWQALCDSISKERDPDKMSMLLDRLIKTMDLRRQALSTSVSQRKETGSTLK